VGSGRGVLKPDNGGNRVLVLTRKIGEVICIGDGIRIVISDIRGSRVRVAIEAPKGLPIQREEIKEREEQRE
jgi:carbon storage regulator